MKKRVFALLICSLVLIGSFGNVVFGASGSTDSGTLRKLTTQEIKQSALDKLNSTNTNSLETEKIQINGGTFYVEWPVAYTPDYQFVDKEAFTVAEFTFDTYGHPEDYKEVTITYSGGDVVTWTISGAIEGAAEFAIIKAKMTVGVERSSTTSTSISASAPYFIKKDSIGVIPVYAYGHKTAGAMKYEWEDMVGNTGYIYKDIQSYLPYSQYSSSYIKFGRLTYE